MAKHLKSIDERSPCTKDGWKHLAAGVTIQAIKDYCQEDEPGAYWSALLFLISEDADWFLSEAGFAANTFDILTTPRKVLRRKVRKRL